MTKTVKKARIQKNVVRIKWIKTKNERDRREYEIKRNRARTIYRDKKERLDD